MTTLRLLSRPLPLFALLSTLFLLPTFLLLPDATRDALAPWLVPSLFGALALAAWEATTTLRIGADGVAVRRRFGLQFVPFRDLTAISENGNYLTLERRGQAPIVVYTSKLDFAKAPYVARCDRAIEALRAGMTEAAARGGRPALSLETPAPHLSNAPYRVALGPDARELLATIEDDLEAPDRRARFAIRVAASPDLPELKQSLAEVARRVADPDLKRVLGESARGDVDAAERAYKSVATRR